MNVKLYHHVPLFLWSASTMNASYIILIINCWPSTVFSINIENMLAAILITQNAIVCKLMYSCH